MPRGDRTGPMGQGPMTGRAAGFCAGYEAPGFVNAGGGRGMRRGRGFGGAYGANFGWNRGMQWYPPQQGSEDYISAGEPEVIKSEIALLEKKMEYLGKRLAELETKNSEKK